jgi:tetratricopeptide (TPR) repeat protein
MIKINLLSLLFILITGVAFCQKKDKKQKVQQVGQETTIASKETQRKNTALFIDAVKERLNGNYTQAEKLLLEIKATDPSHDAARYEYAKILLSKSDYSGAVDELNTAIKLDNTNIWYKVLLAEIYDQRREFALSEKLWNEIAKLQPENPEYLLKYTIALIYQNKLKEAINGYNMIEMQVGINEELIDAKKSIWLHLDKVDNAAKEIEKLAEAYPSESKYYLEIADMYIVNKMQEKAIPYLKKAAEVDPDNPAINVSLYNYYTENKKYNEAFEYLKKAFASPELNIDEKVKILLNYYASPKDSVKTCLLLDNLIQAHPDDPKAWSIYADFLTRDNHLREARTAYEKVIALDDSKYLVWQQYLAVLLDMKEWNEAEKQSLTAMSLFPTQAFSYLVSGIASSAKEEHEKAVSALEEGKQYATEEALIMQFNLFLAESYGHLKEFEKSDARYEELLRKHPQNATFLNNYSYSLSERNHRLEYALQLAKRAVELAPNTAIFEDTYAWAFYKNQDYKNARIWLEKALAHGGDQEYEILIHYSQTLEKLGETTLSEEYKTKAEQVKLKIEN